MQEASEQLVAAIDACTQSPSEATLQAARKAWIDAAEAWQYAQLFTFGPADGVTGTLSENINTFPTSVTKIEAAIAVGDTSLQNFNRDARGLPALDFLLFGGDDVATVEAFKTSAMRAAYTRAVARDVFTQVDRVHAAWLGGYRESFIARSGSDAGSGATQMFNAVNRAFELLKNYKIGIAASVEARYAEQSWPLAQTHMKALRMFWYGNATNGASFTSLRSYILARGGSALEASTREQFDAIDRAASQVRSDVSLASLCDAEDPSLKAYYVELQKLTRFIKSETSSLLGLSITYASGDGD
jgi:predicted lipoprotein